jgi:hypothetical protein
LLITGLLRFRIAPTIEFSKLSGKFLDPKVPSSVSQRFTNRHPNNRGIPLRGGLLFAQEINLPLNATVLCPPLSVFRERHAPTHLRSIGTATRPKCGIQKKANLSNFSVCLPA